ncbi:MAG: LTA synthase family protein [bacterium]|nr:LTA synthase family protein [bacterium]
MSSTNRLVSPIAVYYIAVAILLALFFEVWRGITLFALFDRASAIPASTITGSFLVGLRFDFAIACYITLPLMLLGFLPFVDVTRSKLSRVVNTALLYLAAATAFFIHLADIEFFKFFNTRLNAMALEWSDSSEFIQSMIWESFPVVRYLLLFALVSVGFVFAVRFLQKRILRNARPSSFLATLISLPILAAILLLGIRGRIEEKAPLNWGQAYFSDHAFANLLALNPVFTFGRDLLYDSGSKHDVDRLMSELPVTDVYAKTAALLGLPAAPDDTLSSRIVRPVRFEPASSERPNVILILMESFASAGVSCLQPRVEQKLTPYFDSLSQHGVLFTDFYSAGMHTYAGILGSLYGYPSVPGKSPMKQVTSQDNMSGLPSILGGYGYRTMFFTTHDPHFDNMHGFLKSNGMQEIYSLFDFDESQKLSTLGVPDHVMFDSALERIRSSNGRPFFAALLSGTNHGPWFVPDVPFGPVSDTIPDAKRLNAFKYSDWALGQFVNQIMSEPSLSNTIVLITGDHGLLIDPIYDLDLSLFQVPLLILDKQNRAGESRRIHHIGSQVDIVATVMGLLKLDYDNYTFGHDLFTPDPSGQDYAIFSEGYQIGIVQHNHFAILRPGQKNSLYDIDAPKIDRVSENPGLMAELSDRALSYFQTAYFNLKYPLHLNHLVHSSNEEK